MNGIIRHLFDEEGNVIGVTSLVDDVTQKKSEENDTLSHDVGDVLLLQQQAGLKNSH